MKILDGIFVKGVIVGTMGLVMACSGQVLAQGPSKVTAKIKDVNVQLQQTPLFQASGVKDKRVDRPRHWLEIEMEFETKSDSKIHIVPELLIQYYLFVKGKIPQVLTDSYTYTNIIDEEKCYTIVYVSPSGLARIHGEPNRFQVSDVQFIGAEILFNGRVIAEYSSTKRPWWNDPRAPTKVSGLILSKEQTPFQLLWIDRHLETKTTR